jgi:hypothetical protein
VGTRLTRRIAAEARLAGQAAQLPGSLSGAMAGTTVIGGAVTNHIRVTLEIGYRFELFLLFIVYIWRTSRSIFHDSVISHRRKNEHTHHPLSFRHNNRFGHRIAIARPPNTGTHGYV